MRVRYPLGFTCTISHPESDRHKRVINNWMSGDVMRMNSYWIACGLPEAVAWPQSVRRRHRPRKQTPRADVSRWTITWPFPSGNSPMKRQLLVKATPPKMDIPATNPSPARVDKSAIRQCTNCARVNAPADKTKREQNKNSIRKSFSRPPSFVSSHFFFSPSVRTTITYLHL